MIIREEVLAVHSVQHTDDEEKANMVAFPPGHIWTRHRVANSLNCNCSCYNNTLDLIQE